MWTSPANEIVGFVAFFAVLLVAPQVSNAYSVASVSDLPDGSGIQAILALSTSETNLVNLLPFLAVTARYENADRLHVHITDANKTRWEVPQSLIPRMTGAERIPPSPNRLLHFTYTTQPFGFAITRVSTGEVLFNSTPSSNSMFGPLVFTDLYLEISTSLNPTSSLYGLAESTRTTGLRLQPGRTYTMWNSDVPAAKVNVDLYGSHPYYMDIRKGGSTHTVLLLNSNGMDVHYNGSYLTFKPVGGVFDFYFLAGPTPAKALDQYTQLVGRPAPMPYWTLGFHQCRYGYKNVAELRGVVANYSAAKIPLEALWLDIDHMDEFKDFTLDPVTYPVQEMRALLDGMHKNGQYFVFIIDPGIHLDEKYSAYTRGLADDIFIKNSMGEPFLAQVWPGAVYFPDFLNPKTEAYWTKEITEFHSVVPFDGLWIDMNEASNFCDGTICTVAERPPGVEFTTCFLSCNSSYESYWDNPPYAINAGAAHLPLRTKTIGVNATHAGGEIEYDTHNLFGFSEAVVTNKALVTLTKKRPFVLSRSTFVGSGKYTAHWSGDNGATWDDLRYSVVSVLNSGLFGVPMIGADICGFQFNTTEELCSRWIELGAFYPFSRNHADIHSTPHELYLWESVTKISRAVLAMRYRLLPYLYTLVYEAHMTGAPMARPLFYEYPEDAETYGIDTQYLLGKSLLVSPILVQGATSVVAYLPAGTWYNIFNLSQMLYVPSGTNMTLDAPIDTMNVHVAGGSIIPLQEAAMTTAAVRNSSFTLLVAFSSSDQTQAAGELFLDDGERLDMGLQAGFSTMISFMASKSGTQGMLASRTVNGEYAVTQSWKIEMITLVGLSEEPSTVSIDGHPAPPSVSINQEPGSKVIHISNIDLPLGHDFSLTW